MINSLNKNFIVKVNDLTRKNNSEKISHEDYIKEYSKELKNKDQAAKQIDLIFNKWFRKS